jgi:hypothetical protein
MALSFSDWQRQIASDYLGGGYVTGGPVDVTTAGAQTSIDQLVSKMNNQAPALQKMYAQGLTPEQVLWGQSGKAPTPATQWITTADGGAMIQAPDPGNDPTVANNAWLFNPNKLNDPNMLAYDPSRGAFSPQWNTKQGGWDKYGSLIPIIIASLMTMGGGAAIGAVGGAAGGFGAGGLGSGGTSAFNALTRTLFNADGTSGAAGGGGNPAQAIGAGLFPALLQFLMRGGR